jgi:hypothetical protein
MEREGKIVAEFMKHDGVAILQGLEERSEAAIDLCREIGLVLSR